MLRVRSARGTDNDCRPAIAQESSQCQHQFEAAPGFCFADRTISTCCLAEQFPLSSDMPLRIGDRRINVRELSKPVRHRLRIRSQRLSGGLTWLNLQRLKLQAALDPHQGQLPSQME